jgi:hypothetical protein
MTLKVDADADDVKPPVSISIVKIVQSRQFIDSGPAACRHEAQHQSVVIGRYYL